jgi:type VI protein secretion system component Hcp
MAIDAMLVIPPADGNPTITAPPTLDPVFKGKTVLEVLEFSFGVENEAVPGSATAGAGQGKARFRPLVVKRQLDKASPSAFATLCRGQHFAAVQLYVRKSGTGEKPAAAGEKPYAGFEFQTVFLRDIEWSMGSAGTAPIEVLSFAYGVLVVGVRQPRPDGTLEPSVEQGWSSIANKPAHEIGDLLP